MEKLLKINKQIWSTELNLSQQDTGHKGGNSKGRRGNKEERINYQRIKLWHLGLYMHNTIINHNINDSASKFYNQKVHAEVNIFQ